MMIFFRADFIRNRGGGALQYTKRKCVVLSRLEDKKSTGFVRTEEVRPNQINASLLYVTIAWHTVEIPLAQAVVVDLQAEHAVK